MIQHDEPGYEDGRIPGGYVFPGKRDNRYGKTYRIHAFSYNGINKDT